MRRRPIMILRRDVLRLLVYQLQIGSSKRVFKLLLQLFSGVIRERQSLKKRRSRAAVKGTNRCKRKTYAHPVFIRCNKVCCQATGERGRRITLLQQDTTL